MDIKVFHCLQMAADDLTGRAEQSTVNHCHASSTPRVFGQACMQLKQQVDDGEAAQTPYAFLYVPTMQQSLFTVSDH